MPHAAPPGQTPWSAHPGNQVGIADQRKRQIEAPALSARQRLHAGAALVLKTNERDHI